MSEQAVQTLIAIAEPFHGMFKDLVEGQRSSTGILLPGMNAREDDGEADFGEASELFSRDLGVVVGNPNVILESFASGAGPGTGEERLVVDEEKRIL